MKQLNLLKTLFLLCALMVGSSSVWADNLKVDFESETSAYTDWTFTNMTSMQTNAGVTAHGGSYFGTTGGKATASIVTNAKIASPQSITFYVSKQSTNTTSSSWKVSVSSDGETWDQVGDAQSATSMNKGVWVEVTRDLSSYSDVYVMIEYGSNTAVRCIDDVTLTYIDASKTDVTLSFPQASYTVDIADGVSSFTAPTATATPAVTPITYTSTNTAVATVNETTGAVTLVKKGETTIKASYAGDETYKSAEATYTLTVTNSNANDGSQSKPFTVEEAIEFIEAKEYGDDNYYVKGIISRITSASVSNGTLTYYISDDGTTANDLQVYKGKNLENADFTAVDEIEVGDAVTVVGPLLYYNDSKPEINSGNYIYSITKKETPTLVVEDIEMYVEQEKSLTDLYLINDDYTGTIGFSSSDDAIATISGTKLQAVAVGTATITVTAPATDKYKATTETFAVTVKSRDVTPEGANAVSYVLVEKGSTFAAGDKLIVVCESKNMAMGEQSGTKCDNVAVTINDHTISSLPEGVKVVTLETATSGWYLHTDQGYLTSTAAKSIKVEETTEDASDVTISIDDDNNASIDFGTAGKLQYNASSPRFCTYTSDQTAVQVYRYTESSTFDITMGANGWRSMVSAQNASLPSGLEAYIATAETSDNITLTKVDKIVKNTPVLLKGAEGTYTLTIEESASYSETNLLKISDGSTGNGVFVLAKKGEGVGFYKWNGGKLGAGRVYLEAPAGAHDFLAIDEQTTAISNVTVETKTDKRYYNLNGQVVAQPTKGLYIVNGKKVIIK